MRMARGVRLEGFHVARAMPLWSLWLSTADGTTGSVPVILSDAVGDRTYSLRLQWREGFNMRFLQIRLIIISSRMWRFASARSSRGENKFVRRGANATGRGEQIRRHLKTFHRLFYRLSARTTRIQFIRRICTYALRIASRAMRLVVADAAGGYYRATG